MTNIPTVVNVNVENLRKRKPKINSFIEWSSDPNHVYIGRNNFYVKAPQSKWYNKFTVKEHGLEKALELYENDIRNNEELLNSLHELEGKELGCWCKPEKCHGDVLVKLVRENQAKEIKEDKEQINRILFYEVIRNQVAHESALPTNKDNYGFCSNFYESPMTIDGEVWLYAESYFQAMKFRGKNNKSGKEYEYSELIRKADSPMKVKMLGTQKKNTFRGKKWVLSKKEDIHNSVVHESAKPTNNRLVNDLIDEYKDVKISDDWETRKIFVMIHVLAIKFSNKELQKKLTSVPDNSYFIEHTNRDNIWGDGGDGKGKNYLGKILTCLCHHFKGKKMSKELRKIVKIN